jgi:ribosomal protein S18 acetylase RimI-like enzyme
MTATGQPPRHAGTSAADAVRVRDARDDERDALGALTLRAYAEYVSVMAPAAWETLERAVRAALASEDQVERIVAERGGALVGGVHLFPPATDAFTGYAAPPRWPELRLLAVAPEARGLGVGRALVEECVRRARRMGALELGLHTSRSMRIAMGMYERMGFVRAPEHDFQPEGAELVQAYLLPLDGAREGSVDPG